MAPDATEKASGQSSLVTGAQVLEFAEQNRGRDQQLDIIRDSGMPNGIKSQSKGRLRKLNLSPATAGIRAPSQVGSPILRADTTVDDDGAITRTTQEGTVQATDPARQGRMSRRTDTQQGQAASRREVGPIVNPALLEALRLRGGEASARLSESPQVATQTPQETLEQQLETDRYQGSVAYLTARLDDLASKGEQGP